MPDEPIKSKRDSHSPPAVKKDPEPELGLGAAARLFAAALWREILRCVASVRVLSKKLSVKATSAGKNAIEGAKKAYQKLTFSTTGASKTGQPPPNHLGEKVNTFL